VLDDDSVDDERDEGEEDWLRQVLKLLCFRRHYG